MFTSKTCNTCIAEQVSAAKPCWCLWQTKCKNELLEVYLRQSGVISPCFSQIWNCFYRNKISGIIFAFIYASLFLNRAFRILNNLVRSTYLFDLARCLYWRFLGWRRKVEFGKMKSERISTSMCNFLMETSWESHGRTRTAPCSAIYQEWYICWPLLSESVFSYYHFMVPALNKIT